MEKKRKAGFKRKKKRTTPEPLTVAGKGQGEFLNNPFCPMCGKKIPEMKSVSVKLSYGPFLSLCVKCHRGDN
jgi:hypothetical protein